MMNPSRISACVGAALLFGPFAYAGAPLPGAVFTTDQSGALVNGNTKYASKCGATGVYLDGGPGPNAPRGAASLPDGDYYFQVTDPSGKTLLSTDPVRERCFTVSGGVIVGACPTGTHRTYVDSDYGSSGARTVELCAPTAPFADSPDNGVYKVWATPVGDGGVAGGGFFGDPDRIDNDCGGGAGLPGCFHGFLAARSKTDTFKAMSTVVAPTYCVRAHKQLLNTDGATVPGAEWQISVTDSLGLTTTFYTDEQGSTGDQICGLPAGSYTISEEAQFGYTQISVELNGETINAASVIVTVGESSGEQTVLFTNQYVGGPTGS